METNNCNIRYAEGNDLYEIENSRFMYKPTDMLTYEIDDVNLPLLFPFHLESGDFVYQPILYKYPTRQCLKEISLIKQYTITPVFFNSKGFITEESVDLYVHNKKHKFKLLKETRKKYNQIENYTITGIGKGKTKTKVIGKDYIKGRSVVGTNC